MNKQKGSAQSVLIIVLVLALTTTLGWILWQNFIFQEPVKQQTELVVVDKKTDNKDDEINVSSESDADKLVSETYATYINSRKTGNSVEDALKLIKSNFTDSEYDKLLNTKDREGLTCAVNYVPETVTVSTSTDGSTATSLVTRFTAGQTASSKITVTVDLTTLKINNVSCPQ